MIAILRCDIATIKTRSHEASAIGKKIAETHRFLARRLRRVIAKRFDRKKIIGYGTGAPGDSGEEWIAVKREANHSTWNCSEDQLLNSSPERMNVHCAMQGEQRFFQCGINYRFMIAAGRGVFLHRSPPRSVPSQRADLHVQKKTTPIVQTFKQCRSKKGNLSYLAIVMRYTKVSLSKMENKKPRRGK
jgi:hypothetical protein